MGNFGTNVNPSHYVEAADPSNPGQVMRPVAGTILMARKSSDGTALTDITTTDYGYWSATYAGVDLIDVSGDGGSTWVGPLLSAEGLTAAGNAGTTADQALALGTAAAVNSGTYTAEADTVGVSRRVQYATSGSSPTLFDCYYQPGGEATTEYHTFWLNENGSPRASMGKPSDVAFRAIGYGAGQTGNTFEVQRYGGAGSGARSNDFAIGPDGMPRIGADDVPAALCVVIASTDTAPPVGTPAGTVVIRKRA